MASYALVEFRNYRIVDGRAREFRRYFEDQGFPAELAEYGVDVLGTFEVVGDPSRFVWVRGFRCGVARGEALDRFYTSRFWLERRVETNRLLLEYDNVLLLRPDPTGPPFPPERGGGDGSVVVAVEIRLPPSADGLLPPHDQALSSVAEHHAGVDELARLVIARVVNDYPRLPLRTEANLALWLLRLRPPATLDGLIPDLEQLPLMSRLVLRPSAGSALR